MYRWIQAHAELQNLTGYAAYPERSQKAFEAELAKQRKGATGYFVISTFNCASPRHGSTVVALSS